MPGFYADGEYDIAGFIVGAVDRERIIDGRAIVPGDVLVGLPSAGLHTNGYSLARRVLFDMAGLRHDTYLPEVGATVGAALLAPHRCYLAAIRPLLARGLVKGMAHITGGGITENLPRVLPDGRGAEIELNAWTAPPIFRVIQDRGAIGRDEMYRTFNMGVGLIVICSARDAEVVIDTVARAGDEGARRIGSIVPGQSSVRYFGAP
jgi:phosphoribosylformylglycinamidine cyclo-ligase